MDAPQKTHYRNTWTHHKRRTTETHGRTTKDAPQKHMDAPQKTHHRNTWTHRKRRIIETHGRTTKDAPQKHMDASQKMHHRNTWTHRKRRIIETHGCTTNDKDAPHFHDKVNYTQADSQTNLVEQEDAQVWKISFEVRAGRLYDVKVGKSSAGGPRAALQELHLAVISHLSAWRQGKPEMTAWKATRIQKSDAWRSRLRHSTPIPLKPTKNKQTTKI